MALKGNTHAQGTACPCGYIPLATRRDIQEAKDKLREASYANVRNN